MYQQFTLVGIISILKIKFSNMRHKMNMEELLVLPEEKNPKYLNPDQRNDIHMRSKREIGCKEVLP